MDPQNGPSGAGANDPQPKGNSKGPEDTLPPDAGHGPALQEMGSSS